MLESEKTNDKKSHLKIQWQEKYDFLIWCNSNIDSFFPNFYF